jgi:hypothetical protein
LIQFDNQQGTRVLKKLYACSLAALALGGCASYSPSVPLDYSGPKATVRDSVKVYSSSKADFFYLSHVDGKKIEDSRSKTLRMNRGQGMQMTPFVLENAIPAKPIILSIVGRTEYAAPILALTNTVYQLKGEVEFSPEPNKTYFVRGELGEDYSAIWIEDPETRAVIGKKIEATGSTKLGTFEK